MVWSWGCAVPNLQVLALVVVQKHNFDIANLPFLDLHSTLIPTYRFGLRALTENLETEVPANQIETYPYSIGSVALIRLSYNAYIWSRVPRKKKRGLTFLLLWPNKPSLLDRFGLPKVNG